MKPRKRERGAATGGSAGLPSSIEFALLALPILALTPNIFAPPALGMLGLATQELVLAIYATLLVTLGGWRIFRMKTATAVVARPDGALLVMLAAYLGWQLLSVSWAPTRYEALRVTGIWFGFGIFFFAGLWSLGPRAGRWLFHLLTLICLVLSLTVLYERSLHGANMFGFFFNHGITAEILVTLLPLQLLQYFQADRKEWTGIYLIVSLLTIVALLAGMRRGALLAMGITLGLMVLAWGVRLIRIEHPRRIAWLLAIVLIGAAAGGIYKRDEVIYRFKGATQLGAAEGGLSTRLRSWLTAWEMFKAHPIKGVGQAGYPSLYGEYRGVWVSRPENSGLAKAAGPEDFDEIRSPLPHNEYLETVVELGVTGLILLALFWGNLGWRLWRRLRETGSHWPAGVLLGLLAFGISSFSSGFSFRYTPSPAMLACVLAIGLCLSGPEGERPSIFVPRWTLLAALSLLLIPSILLIGRNYNVFAGQQLQGQATLDTEPLDFAFYPNDESGNERLRRRYEEVLRLDSENSGAHLGLALLLYQMKKPGEALPHSQFALRHGYSRPFAYVLTAFIHEQLGDLPQAVLTMRECARSYPISFFVRASLVEMLRQSGQVEEMRAHQKEMYLKGERNMRSWELALRANRETAQAEARQQDLLPPNKLWPTLAATLVAMRAHHYLSRPSTP